MGRGFIILGMVNALVAIIGRQNICQPIIYWRRLKSKVENPISFCEAKANTRSFTLADGKELLQMVPVPQSHLRKSLNNSTFL
jgi:hypothetical protein